MTKRLFLDNECYVDYFLAMFMADDGRSVAFEKYEDQELDTERLTQILTSGVEIVTFNGLNYDIPLLAYALAGATCAQLKQASDDIIANDMKGWQFERKYPGVPLTGLNHIDLMEVAPGQNSLKIYGGRLHCLKLQDLPIDPDASISAEDRPVIRRYCKNDLFTTKALADDLTQQIDLRRTMMSHMREELEEAKLSHLMKVDDLRSKSDAQIAEAVLRQRVFVRSGAIPRKRPIHYKKFRYEPPKYIQFKSDALKHALQVIRESDMVIKPTGHVEMPAAIDKLDLTIGATTYKIGIGGIHSQESEVTHVADDEVYLRDIDVRSYYPNLMLNMGMYPDTMGPHFLHAYRDILTERLIAKDTGDKVKDATLKIVLNGTFGKTSSQYSILYNPKLMIGTTLTGQLSILMLIEALERFGIPVVSANTDGIVVKCPRKLEDRQRTIVKAWESVANLETEETDYSSIHSRDVNSYIAVKLDGKVKTKGFFAKSGLWKNPQNEVCVDAVVAYLQKGTPIEETVQGCTDLRKFVTIRRVTGGAEKDGELIGKVVRWYYANGVSGTFNYVTNGNSVPRSSGAKPVMEMPDVFPDDVDYSWYIEEARGLLMDIGALPRPPKARLPRRNTKEWKELEALGHVEVDDYGKPQWAIPYSHIPGKYKTSS